MALSENLDPSLPPLFDGIAADDPFVEAVSAARMGTDAGRLAYLVRPDRMAAALVLAPETPLRSAISIVLVVANGFADAFGALAPSEIACQFEWPGTFRINGARCGRMRVIASTTDPEEEPDWLVVGVDIPFFTQRELEPGNTPDETTLWEEGCSDIEPVRLLESWSRHTLVWIHEWLEDGAARAHRDWTGRAWGLGETGDVSLAGRTYHGTLTGLDEYGGLLLSQEGRVELLPLTGMLEGID